MALADHADDDGTNCWPAVPYVAWKTGYSDRQVRRIMKELRDAGALIPVTEESPGQPVHYQVAMGVLPEKARYERPKRYLSPAARVRIIERDQRTCRYCERPGTWTTGPDGQRWHIDRVVPAAQGGTYEESNIVLACGTCNRTKGAKLAHPNIVPAWVTPGVADGAISAPSDAVVTTADSAIAESPKPSITTIEPPEEPSTRAWVTGLREIDGWAEKGEPHLDSLKGWVEEKGWTEEQLEASAIGLASCSDKTLKGYRDMAAAFQRRLNQGYDDSTRQSGDNGRGVRKVSPLPGGEESGAGSGWDNRG